MTNNKVRWTELLDTALTEPGKISEAFRAFHCFSFGNMLLAMSQCHHRELAMGPINTYKGWQGLGRQVKRGAKALMLCMPITIKRKRENDSDDEPASMATFFVYRRNWFVLSQTDGADMPELDTPEWNAEQACSALGVKLMEFDRADGNVQGFFRRSADAVAVSPLAEHARQTLFHELAHAVLHGDKDAESRSIEELEAECTAMLVADALGLGGLDDSRSYVQGWYKDGQQIPEKSAKRILHAADKILKAGQVEEPLAQAA